MSEQDFELWARRARFLAEKAYGEMLDGDDATATLEAAEAATGILAGRLLASALDGYPFPGELRLVKPQATP